jgi:hypothetical protein
MESMGMGPGRRRRRGSAACNGRGIGLGRGLGRGRGATSAKDDTSLAARTATRAVIAAGTYVAQDVRDRDGLTRPMLRRAALRMAVSRQAAMRRLGTAYLRADPPALEELPAVPAQGSLPPFEAAHAHVIDVDPATVVEVEAVDGRQGV